MNRKEALIWMDSVLSTIKDKYFEEIYTITLSYINEFDNINSKKDWNKGKKEILNQYYKAFEELYKTEKKTLKKIYKDLPNFTIKNIKDLTYQEDGKTLEDRIDKYWEEIYIALKNELTNISDIKLHGYNSFMRIIRTEFNYIRNRIIKNNRPPEALGIEVTPGECGSGGCAGGFFPDGDVDPPPYHSNCGCSASWVLVDDEEEIEDLDLEADIL